MSATLTTRRRPSHLAVVGETKLEAKQVSGYPINVIACWSGAGSPGRSTIAINLATELALQGEKILLVDLDTLAPALALSLGLVETPAGLSALLRLAEQGRLSYQEFQRLTVTISLGRHELVLLPGLANPNRWAEVTPERLEKLFQAIVGFVDHVVLDLPIATGNQNLLVHPSAMLDSVRDALLRDVLVKSRKLVLVSGSDPVAAKRFIEAHEYLVEAGSSIEPIVVVNRFRTSALGPNARAELMDSYERLAKLRIDCFVADEPENLDKCLRNGLPLALLKRSSSARQAIGELAKIVMLTTRNSQSVAKLS
jgi:MinD-like ATPase involved in chromosome partitioning or flagellar assembly